MLSIAKGLLEAEAVAAEATRNTYMDETCPHLELSGSLADLQVDSHANLYVYKCFHYDSNRR